MDSKGFFNIELIILLMFLLVVFAMLASISLEEFSAIEETQNRKEARIIASDVTGIINEVYMSGDNYSKVYNLPDKINNETYVLQINTSGVYINSHYQMTYSKPLSGITYNPQKIYLEHGNVYEFINKANTVQIKQLN